MSTIMSKTAKGNFMAPRDPQLTVRDLVVRHPALRQDLEKLGIDYCCGGAIPIAEAAHIAGQPLSKVMAALEGALRAVTKAGTDSVVDWSEASATMLAEHIERKQHTILKEEWPRLEDLFGKMVRAHGEKLGEMLQGLHATSLGLKRELEPHPKMEEQVLFPAIRCIEAHRLAAGPKPVMHCGSIQNPIRQMKSEHENAGEPLFRMREITSDFAALGDACPTFTALFEGLAAVEADLHEHIHLESNILFPEAIAMESAKL